MNRWPIEPLGAFIEERTERLRQGAATIYSVTNENGFVRSLDLFDKQVFSTDTGNYKRVECHDLAYNPSRINVGSVAICEDKDGGAVSPMYVIVRCKPDLLPSYLLHFLKSASGLKQIRHRCEGAVRFQLKYRDLCAIPILIPPIAEQVRIVNLLDEVDELRKLRAHADQRTTDIIPALFLEMFGNVVTNPLAWPTEKVGNLFNGRRGGARCGPFGSALKKHEYQENGIPVWGIPNVLPNQFVETGSLFISPSKYDQLRAYAVEEGDLLISRAGTVGRICVVRPQAQKSIIGTNLIRLTLDQRRVVPEFFATLMTYFGKDVGTLRANADEDAYSFMNTKVLRALEIYLPPLALQKDFLQRITESRALEPAQSSSRQRLEALSKSTLHRAFSGNL